MFSPPDLQDAGDSGREEPWSCWVGRMVGLMRREFVVEDNVFPSGSGHLCPMDELIVGEFDHDGQPPSRLIGFRGLRLSLKRP